MHSEHLLIQGGLVGPEGRGVNNCIIEGRGVNSFIIGQLAKQIKSLPHISSHPTIPNKMSHYFPDLSFIARENVLAYTVYVPEKFH